MIAPAASRALNPLALRWVRKESTLVWESAWQAVLQMLEAYWAQLDEPAEWWALVAGALGGGLVVVSAFVRTMIPLRWLAVGSNAGFIVYGLLHHNGLLVALHLVLLPVNLWRVWQMVVLTRRANASGLDPQQLQVWLQIGRAHV